jgi:hypothetical protein
MSKSVKAVEGSGRSEHAAMLAPILREDPETTTYAGSRLATGARFVGGQTSPTGTARKEPVLSPRLGGESR